MSPIDSKRTWRRASALAGAMALSTVLAACSGPKPEVGVADPAPTRVVNGVLTGANGKTLYTSERDVTDSGKSSCLGDCAVAWPPLTATGDSGKGDYTVITRPDNSKQWAYRGKPLYYFSRDVAAGDIMGEGVANVWHVARP
ncbi:hypothetical protein BH09PSE6_BH09PSE6_22990 [soil metagenome]